MWTRKRTFAFNWWILNPVPAALESIWSSCTSPAKFDLNLANCILSSISRGAVFAASKKNVRKRITIAPPIRIFNVAVAHVMKIRDFQVAWIVHASLAPDGTPCTCGDYYPYLPKGPYRIVSLPNLSVEFVPFPRAWLECYFMQFLQSSLLEGKVLNHMLFRRIICFRDSN